MLYLHCLFLGHCILLKAILRATGEIIRGTAANICDVLVKVRFLKDKVFPYVGTVCYAKGGLHYFGDGHVGHVRILDADALDREG